MKNPVVRLEGLPFRVTKEELAEFFEDCSLPDGVNSIHLIMNREGRASGLGYVEVKSNDDIEKATGKSQQNIGRYSRYAKITECRPEELQWYLNRTKDGGKKKFRIRMHGLPFRASEYEIAKWFEPESKCSDVEIHMNREGRPSGEATAFFDTEALADKAMDKDKEDMNGRYINLTKSSSGPLSRSGFFVRMAGLPFRATEDEIKDFFKPVADCVGVRIIYNRDGRPSGDAVAEFESNEMAEKAMKKNREHLGSRFVVLTREDAGESHGNGADARSGSGSGFTIRMGGLPFRATVQEIMDWFNPEASCSHVRVLMNRDGRPSGEALAEFDTEEMAEKAMAKNKQYMGERFVILTAQY